MLDPGESPDLFQISWWHAGGVENGYEN